MTFHQDLTKEPFHSQEVFALEIDVSLRFIDLIQQLVQSITKVRSLMFILANFAVLLKLVPLVLMASEVIQPEQVLLASMASQELQLEQI